MIKEKNLKILECWNITGRGIIAELQYNGKGLPEGTILKSSQKNIQWKIKNRLLFNHTLDKQKRFPNEKEIIMRFHFRPIENLEKSEKDIQNKEEKGIYQYEIEGIGHDQKPEKNEQLEIEK
jgi:hypothetical protein